MNSFAIVLKNEKLKFYYRLSWFIIIILLLLYSYLSFFASDNFHTGRKIFLVAIIAVAFALKLYFEKTKYKFGLPIFFSLLVAGFILNENYLPTGITFFFGILHMISVRQKTVVFYKEKIIYPSFPAKTIEWQSLNNCLLKDNLLTIDFKNNKIIQQLIDESKTSVNEKEFNEFCTQQLGK